MTDEDKIGTPQDESNIDQINSFVTSSTDTQSQIEEEPEVVEELTEEKTEVKLPEEHKPESKPKVDRVKPQVVAPMVHTPVKKPEIKKEAKEKPKPINHVVNSKKSVEKHEPKKIVKSKAVNIEPKKVVKETPKVEKKTLVKPKKIVKKSVKEDKMANHKEHKEHNKEHKNKFRISKNTLLWVGIGVLAAVLVIALILILSPGKQQPALKNQTSNTVAATVNGEPIYLDAIKTEYDNLNPAVKSQYTIESILNKSIDDLILYQEAQNKGIKVSADSIKAEIDNIKIENQMTDTAFEKALAQQGLTVKDAEQIIGKTLLIRKYLNETILKDIVISKDAIQQYYDANLDQFKTPEKVTAQHILITISPNVTDEMAKAKIEQIQKELTDTNFCELVTKYSEDPGSLKTCGTYTFGRGEMVAEFENPAFDMNIGESAIVKTQFGYHLIKKLGSTPAGIQNLSEVSKDIESTLHDEAAQAKFDTLMVGLRVKAKIVNYLTKVDNNESTAVVTKPNVVTPSVNATSMDDFAKCLTEKKAALYGAYWCPHCNNQKLMFGDSLQYINYIECAVEGQPQVQTEACTKAGIGGYPTWIIDGKSYPGEQDIAKLAQLTGCTAPQ